ncbi:MAG: hypothetical protein A3K46_06785 [Chloroflexi bacterium RBG_13_60_9]|nr:MAG: hypothetical protein A3K46_06785 [Chloroflexi bacterium RBG_13_60_9]
MASIRYSGRSRGAGAGSGVDVAVAVGSGTVAPGGICEPLDPPDGDVSETADGAAAVPAEQAHRQRIRKPQAAERMDKDGIVR